MEVEIEVEKATGQTLDWMVGIACQPDGAKMLWKLMKSGNWKPSSDWRQGGPILEKERIDLQTKINAGSDCDYDEWLATSGFGINQFRMYGNTPLVAAMRCYVASKLGRKVKIPAEFLGK